MRWLLKITLVVSIACGRLAKIVAFWTRARWVSSQVVMKMEGRELIWRVRMGPCLVRSRRRMGSKLEKSWEDLRSHSMLPKKGMVGGPVEVF
ncbi:hypothetical protein CsSME_00036135 [Camellia sinensis var. sinensis]